jgi:hypothetical protein
MEHAKKYSPLTLEEFILWLRAETHIFMTGYNSGEIFVNLS